MHTRAISNSVSAAALLALIPFTAWGAIVSTFGQAIHIAPPPSVMTGALNTPMQRIFAFEEVRNTTYAGRVSVMHPAPGISYDWTHSIKPFVTIPGVTSHFIHADEHPSAPSVNVVGRVTFADPIVAVIFENVFLDASDGSLGLSSVTYPAGTTNRGFSVAFSGNDRFRMISPWTIEFTLGAALDQVRVLTVPTPGAIALAGLGGLIATRRRR